MSALALLTLLAVTPAEVAEAPPVSASGASRLEADVAFVYGFGARMAFGGAASAASSWRLCDTPALECRVRTGVFVGYQNEPFSTTSALFAPTVVEGSGHRAEVFGTVGFSANFFSSRRLRFDVDFFAGWTGLWLAGTLRNTELGLDRSTRASGHELTFGFNYTLGFRVTERVSVVARIILPIPWAGVAKSSYFMASLGPLLTF